MLYAILCYHAEGEVTAMTKAQDDALMAELIEAKQRLSTKVRFGPVARLMPTTAATSVRSDGPANARSPLLIDGPFAETKEQLLGFYVLECESLEQAIEVARVLQGPRDAAGLHGTLEVRPLRYYEANQ